MPKMPKRALIIKETDTRTQKRRLKSPSLKDERPIDFTKYLSDELILHIFYFLGAYDLSICSRVSTNWYRLANDLHLWKNLFLSRFPPPRRPWPLVSREPTFGDKRFGKQVSPMVSRLEIVKQSVARKHYGQQDWKSMFQISHNWFKGKYRVNSLDPASLLDVRSKKEEASLLTPNPLVQFTKDIILTAVNMRQELPVIEVWRAVNSLEYRHVVSLRSALMAEKELWSDVSITCLRLDSEERESGWRVLAGFSNGGFSLWEMEGEDVKELFTQPVCTTTGLEPSPIIAVALNSSIFITCTLDFILSIYLIKENERENDGKFPAPVLLHQLKGYIFSQPVELSLVCMNELDCASRDRRWKTVIGYSVPILNGGWTLGYQEILFSEQRILWTRHTTSISSIDSHPFSLYNDSGIPSFAAITSIAHSSPYIFTAHIDNTIQVFHVHSDNNTLELHHSQTLYGHTSRVMSLSVDGCRLVSADQWSIKVWELSQLKNGDSAELGNFIVSLTDFPLPCDEEATATEHSAEQSQIVHRSKLHKGLQWVAFDESRIISVGSRPRLRCQDEARTKGEYCASDIGLVKIWSFI
ncbi:uncharacterized protein VTP21DRAFT_2063 [Calcarisporiella thermophila]|uniref:uncharacterized protein n=1 Tax=Calcarisporiella thermophila TaxID=911321 RepID=UPI0037442E9A